MSRASVLTVCVSTVLFSVCGREARAQPPVPGGPAAAVPRPAFSPYLNLLRAGNAPALNYYGLVRPEVQFRQSILNLQGAVSANQQAIGTVQTEVEGVPATGHPIQFLNYGGYFLNNGPTVGAGLTGVRPGATYGATRTGPVGMLGGLPSGFGRPAAGGRR